ncbi:hypothetical protein AYO38_11790 [bacterium SCGC AG-212-C10]|nr:hypothetical protein AYO38_11790 [bacterium SCGC AG-212-C10]
MSIESTSFPPEVVAAVQRHVNEDLAEDCLIICRALGGAPTAKSATMTGCDSRGVDFTIVVSRADATVRIPWAERVTNSAEIRSAVTRLYRDACKQLGITPREEAR